MNPNTPIDHNAAPSAQNNAEDDWRAYYRDEYAFAAKHNPPISMARSHVEIATLQLRCATGRCRTQDRVQLVRDALTGLARAKELLETLLNSDDIVPARQE